MRLISVALPIPSRLLWTYSVPPSMPLPSKGGRAVAPVGKRRRMIGIVWDNKLEDALGDVDYEIKEIHEVIDHEPLLHGRYMSFIERVAQYYFYPIGQVIDEALPSALISSKKGAIEAITGGNPPGCKGVAPSIYHVPKRPESINKGQLHALNKIIKAIHSRKFSPVLLYGVTGSGKTEVYLRASQEAHRLKRGVLVLVPEIALATHIISYFYEIFKDRAALWHSRVTAGQKVELWNRVIKGSLNVIVGARSAIFAPFEDIGLIIVDEEHDTSYKQDSRLLYNARDLALLLGKLHNATVVLGSATPSIGSFRRAKAGEYMLLELKSRAHNAPLPDIEVVDMADKSQRHRERPWWLSNRLFEAINDTVSQGGQALLFINRRGFAPFVFCKDCGHTFLCPNCEVALTFHKNITIKGEEGALICHLCGYIVPAFLVCPDCNGLSVGTRGIGTEKVIEELAGLFPTLSLLRFDRDTMGAKSRLFPAIRAISKGKIDIIVGTQMITKGYDFPSLMLVGVIWADQSLYLPSFNAAEKTFQLLTQVSGRAGRRESQGRVIIQTFSPNQYAIKAASRHDMEEFYQEELKRRQRLNYPPYGYLINLIFSGKDNEKLKNYIFPLKKEAQVLASQIKRRYTDNMIYILGPAPAVRPRVNKVYIWNMLLKSLERRPMRTLLAMLLNKIDQMPPMGVRLQIDCDPVALR